MGYPKSSEHEVPSFDEVMSEKKQTQVPSFDEVMGADVKKKEPTDSNNGVKPSSPTPSNSTSQSVFGKFPTKDEYNTTHPAQAVDEGGFQPTNLSSRKKRVMAVSDYLPAIKDMNQKAIADETFRQKPITDIDVKDKLQRAEQHKENVKQAIKNTTEKRLKIMGIDAPEGSPLYNEQKAKIEKAVLNGDATYHSKDGVPGLDRTVKWNEDLVNGWNEAIDANDEAATFANDMTTEQQVEFLNKKQTEQPPSEFYENRSGVGHLVGGAGPFLAKATAGAVVGGALAAAAPETGGLSLAGLPTAMSFIFTAPDAKNQGILREVSSRYQIIKNEHPEMSDVDAMEEAKKGGVLAGGVGGIVENALFMGAMDVPIPLQGKSVIGKFVKGTLKSGANMGAATAVANAGQLAERAAEGYKVTPEQVIDSSIETFKENFTAGSLLHAVMQGVAGVGNIPKAVKSAFKFGLKDTPMESIVSTLDANVKAGNVSPEVATKTVEDIEGYRAALAKTAQGLTPETQASVAGLIQAKDNLIAEMATKDETQHAPYQEKIAALNEQIKKITETNDPLKYEVDDVTGKPLGEPATETTEVKGNPEEISQPIELSVEPKKEEVVPNEPLSDVSGEGSVGVGGDVGSTTNVLNETQKSNPTVWQKIKDAFNNLVSKTKEYLNKAKGTQYEELAKVLGDHLKNVRTSTIEDLKGVLGEKIGGQLQKLHILVNSGKGDLQTFFHEAMHHITFEKISQYLNNNHENLKPHEIDAIQNLQRIFTDSKAKIEAMKVKTSFHYGFTNLHEFISEAFSNPEFQRLLKELPSEGKHPTVFKAFLDAIAKLMGLKDATILNDIFHHTEKLLDKPKSENEGIAELYHQAKAEGTHPDFVKAVEQSLKETPKSETKPIQNEPAKEEPVSAVSSEVGGVGAGGDVKVQGSEYKGVTGTTSVNVKEKDGIIKATFKGTRSDKPNATIGASGYRYGGKAVKETLSDFEKDYGVKVDEIIDGVDIAEITVLEERAEVNPRQGVGTGQSVTLRIRDTDGNIINDVNIVVNKRKFTEQPKSENKPIQKEPVKEEPVSAVSSEVEDSSMPTSLRGVKYSDIVVGDKHLEDILSDNKLSEDEKKQVREIFARGVDYFKFDKEGEQKFQEKFSNPEDITDVADIITGVSAAQQSAFNFHNTKNYDNVKDAVNYIANNPNDYSPKVVKAVKEIKQKLDNPSSSMNRLYAIDVMKELGIKENPVPQEVKSETKPIQNEQTKANEVSITQEGESPTTTTVDKVSGTAEEATGGKPPTETEVVNIKEGSDNGGITQAANAVRRQLLNEPEFQKNPQSFAEWTNEAENLLKNGYDVEKLMDRLEKDPDATPVENAIRKIYIATLDAEIEKNPTNALLAKQKRFIEIGDRVNRAAGQKLVSLKGQGNPLGTISDFYVAKMEANNTDVLTDAQKAEVQKDYDAYKKRAEDAEAKLQLANEKLAEFKAQQELNKGTHGKKRTPKTKEEFKEQRQSLKDKLKQQFEEFKAEGQKLGVKADDKSFIISAKMAKTVLEIVRSHVAEVGNDLKEVTKRTFEDVKDLLKGISEKDVHDIIAGEYSEKRKTISQLNADMRDVKDEAKYVNQLEKLLAGKEPKSENAKRERNEKITELKNKIKAFRAEEKEANKFSKEEITDDAKKLEAIKKANLKRAEQIRKDIAEGNFEKKAKPISVYDNKEFQAKYPKLYKEVLDSQNAKHEAELDFQIKLIEDEMKDWGLGEKIRSIVKKSSGTVKHIFASFDMSAIAVQNLPFIASNPSIGAKGIAHSMKEMVSQKEFDRYLTELHNSPDWPIIKECIRVTEPKSLLESGKEEYFPDRFKAVIKIKGKEYGYIKTKNGKYELFDLSKPFERQFTSLGNWLRVVKFRTDAEKLYEKGFTWEKNPEEFKTLGKRINNLTSSADIPTAYQNEITKTLIWSTRLIAAKLNMLGISDVAAMFPGTGVKKGYYKSLGIKGQKISRQQFKAVGDLAKFATSAIAATYLYSLATKGKINTNPDSNGFLDVEYGDGKSMNFTGGFSRYMSLLMQLYNGGKTDKSGVFSPYENKKTDRLKEIGSFILGKAPPITRSVMNLAAGKDMGNNEVDIATEASKYKMPLALGQIKAQIDKDGYGSLFNEGILTFIGFNSKDQRDMMTQDITQPEWKYLASKGVRVVPHKKETLTPIDSNNKPIEVTDEKYKEFIQKREDYIKEDIKKLIDGKGFIEKGEGNWEELKKSDVKDLTTDELKGWLMTKTTQANEKAMMDVFKGTQAPKNTGKRKIETE